MKTKCFAIIAVSLLVSLTAVAQDAPKAELFGGYQYTRLNPNGAGTGFNFNGWNASLTGNANKWFGVTGDFSGIYKSISGVSVKAYTYTFGPTFAVRKSEAVTPFVHALFGGFHASANFAGASTDGFAMMIGGGVDAKLSQHLALRAVQFDWVMLRDSGVTENKNVRVSTGLVFRF
jgi:hypothetical protein